MLSASTEIFFPSLFTPFELSQMNMKDHESTPTPRSHVHRIEPLTNSGEPYFSEDLDPRVQLGQSAVAGRGLFAIAPISRGDVVWRDMSTPSSTAGEVTLEELGRWEPQRRERFLMLAWQKRPGVFETGCSLDDPTFESSWASDYYNHSCDPSTVYDIRDGTITLIAARDIMPGEEITYDYVTEGGPLEFDCRCGASSCRGKYRAEDWQRSDIQERYKGHFLPQVQMLIDALEK